MKNEALFQRYEELCIASYKVAQHVLGDKRLVAWWNRGSDAEMHRRLRGRSGIDKDSGFTDFSPPDLAPYFSAFVEEALKDPILSRLYSDKDLGPILIYQLTQSIRLLAPLVEFSANADESKLEETLAHRYAKFENLLYEEAWITVTIYPLVNFYSKDGWEKRQPHKSSGLDDTEVIFPGSTFQIDNNLELGFR